MKLINTQPNFSSLPCVPTSSFINAPPSWLGKPVKNSRVCFLYLDWLLDAVTHYLASTVNFTCFSMTSLVEHSEGQPIEQLAMVHPAQNGFNIKIRFKNLSYQKILIQVFLSFSKWLSWFFKKICDNQLFRISRYRKIFLKNGWSNA